MTIVDLKSVSSLEKRMAHAQSYEAWVELAKQHDELTGMESWRFREQSDDYDYHEISMRLHRLKQLLGRNDHVGLLFALNEGIHGNMGGMGNPILYNKSQFGTKQLITDYIQALAEAIERVVSDNCDEIPAEEKLDFLRRASHCFGRSALMLSGGGNFGMFHVGVVQALRETDALPHIISGSSAGALVAGCLGTHDSSQLDRIFSEGQFANQLSADSGNAELTFLDRVIFGNAKALNLDYLDGILDEVICDMTFAESFELTGREINISISPQEEHQTPRLLNAITSPNVLIRSAVKASCAIPGVFPAVTLEAKAANGDKIPYLPSRKWIDGSVVGDLPAKRLARLYGVNHFVVSLANPLVLWAKSDPKIDRGIGANLSRLARQITKEGFNGGFRLTKNQLKRFPSVNYAANMAHSVLNQSYSGDVNIYPSFRFFNPRMLFKQLSSKEVRQLADMGRSATWPKIEMLRNCMLLSNILDDALARTGNDYNELLLPKSTYQKKTPSAEKAA